MATDTEKKREVGKPIETKAGFIHPNLSHDKFPDGSEIKAGFMRMGTHAATFKHTHKGKKYTGTIVAGFDGTTEIRIDGGRSYTSDLNKLLEDAIEHGLMEDTLTFKREIK